MGDLDLPQNRLALSDHGRWSGCGCGEQNRQQDDETHGCPRRKSLPDGTFQAASTWRRRPRQYTTPPMITNSAAPPITLSRKSHGSAVSEGAMVATTMAPTVSS